MLGAIIGDTAGSRFEFDNYRHTGSGIFSPDNDFTDDTIRTVATVDWASQGCSDNLASILQGWCRIYSCPKGVYGSHSSQRIERKNPALYNSWGNGSAMRVFAIGWVFTTLEETLRLAEQSTIITHNHPEGIKGTQVVAVAILWARTGMGKAQIKENITRQFGYDLSQSCSRIRPHYRFNEGCQETVPQAVTAFFESDNFEYAIRLAVSLGGDSGTLAAITGSIAEAYHGTSVSMREHALAILLRRIAETLLVSESQYQAV